MRKIGSIILALILLAVPAQAAYQAAVTIANGAALSSAADLTAYIQSGGKHVVGLIMPAAWTTANITMQASEDGTNFSDIHLQNGTEYTLTNSAAAQYIILTASDLAGANYLKVRSGTSGSPVNQGAARTLNLLISP